MMAYLRKEDQAASAKRFYEKNKALCKKRASERNKKQIESLKIYILNLLKSSKCIDCGNDDFRVLEFDHVRGEKKYNISHMVFNYVGIYKLKEEIQKCDVRCCNCHRIKTRKTLWNKQVSPQP